MWFFKKNCAESVTEAKQIWDTIQQNELKRVDLNTFSKGYASEILLAQKNYKSLLDKSTKLLHTQQKLMAYIDSLDKLFDADFEQILRLEQSRKAHPQPFFNAHDGV